MTVELTTLQVRSRRQWRAWLSKHHMSSPGLWLVFYKAHTGVKSIRYEGTVRELPPFADDLAREVKTRGDDIVPQIGRGEKDDLRAYHVSIRRRILARNCLESRPLVASERDEKRTPPGHSRRSVAERNVPQHLAEYNKKYVTVIMKSSTKLGHFVNGLVRSRKHQSNQQPDQRP